jgi:transposase InsO family protein
MNVIAHECRRFGYRRVHVLLKRECYVVNNKKLYLYREEKLAVRRRGSCKRAIGTRAPMTIPLAPNERWSLDFVSDQLTDVRRFRTLAIVDDCTRECLTLLADTSLSGLRVARELDHRGHNFIVDPLKSSAARRRARHGFERQPDAWRAGDELLERTLCHLLRHSPKYL